MAARWRSPTFRREWLAPPQATSPSRSIPIHACEPPLVWLASWLAAALLGGVAGGTVRPSVLASTAVFVLVYGLLLARDYGAAAVRAWLTSCTIAAALGVVVGLAPG